MNGTHKVNLAALAMGLAAALVVRAEPRTVGDDLQVLWDDDVVDTQATTATRVLHHPEYAGPALVHDAPWEGDGSDFHNILTDRDEKGVLYRLYYLGWSMHLVPKERDGFSNKGIRVCYAESRDGIHWVKPDLGLVEFNGSKANNILFDETENKWDNFMVFKDANPSCPPEMRYKAVARTAGFKDRERIHPVGPELGFYHSADGVHFKRGGWVLLRNLGFDTLNVGFWDAVRGEYHLYVRAVHRNEKERNGDVEVRDIRHAVSKDFKVWSEPKRLDFTDAATGAPAEDMPLYTNMIEPYPRAPKLFVGFPSRYVERRAWTKNYDRLPDVQARRWRMDPKHGGSGRYGLVVTDCAFIMSRDGQAFQRDEEAFLRPAPEHAGNWVYGECYPVRGLIETPGRVGDDREFSMFLPEYGWSGKAKRFNRYALRLDGFVSRQAPYAGAKVVTKPLVFSGSELLVNFATSARGRLFVTVRDDKGAKLRSVELFGNKVDRPVDFESGRLADFAGKPVTVEFEMYDADLYSFRFRGGQAE